jgi:predicted RNA binding protein YcfA (HicA-like mRNA interferase family)
MCKVLERKGWELQRISGSHHIYQKSGVVGNVSVPVHGAKKFKKKALRRAS